MLLSQRQLLWLLRRSGLPEFRLNGFVFNRDRFAFRRCQLGGLGFVDVLFAEST